VYFTATEVVLLLKLGGNEVFFEINQRKNYGFCTTYLRALCGKTKAVKHYFSVYLRALCGKTKSG
jgi:hypothetical protein